MGKICWCKSDAVPKSTPTYLKFCGSKNNLIPKTKRPYFDSTSAWITQFHRCRSHFDWDSTWVASAELLWSRVTESTRIRELRSTHRADGSNKKVNNNWNGYKNELFKLNDLGRKIFSTPVLPTNYDNDDDDDIKLKTFSFVYLPGLCERVNIYAPKLLNVSFPWERDCDFDCRLSERDSI